MAKLNFGGVEETVITREEYPLSKALETLKDETIAVIGYGVQGPGQGLDLRDNGFNVIVGQREGKTYDKAVADGWKPGETLFSIEEACERGTIIMCLLSDAAVISQWPTIKKHLTPGKALYFSHGFAINWSDRTGVVPPADVDVIMVAPRARAQCSACSSRRAKAPTHRLQYIRTPPAARLTALLLSASVSARATCSRPHSSVRPSATSLASAVRSWVLSRVFFLRSMKCSARTATLPPRAFNETVEELTQSLMPLFAAKGMDWMYANCSTTAQRGALDWMGPFHDAIKPVVRDLYESVKTGREAQRSIDSNTQPDYREKLEEELKALRESEMWRTGAVVRTLRPRTYNPRRQHR